MNSTQKRTIPLTANGKPEHAQFRLQSNYTQIPNWVLDNLMGCRGLGAAEFRVLLFILRKTLGWGRDEDYISLSQIEHGANVPRAGALAALRLWIELGVISVLPVGKRRMNLVRLRSDTPLREVVNGILARNTERIARHVLREEQKLRQRVGLVS